MSFSKPAGTKEQVSCNRYKPLEAQKNRYPSIRRYSRRHGNRLLIYILHAIWEFPQSAHCVTQSENSRLHTQSADCVYLYTIYTISRLRIIKRNPRNLGNWDCARIQTSCTCREFKRRFRVRHHEYECRGAASAAF